MSVSHILPNLKCHKAMDWKDLFCTEIFCTCSFKDGVTTIGNIKCLAIQIRDWSCYSPCILSDRWTWKLLSCADPVFFKDAPLKENNWFFFPSDSTVNDVQTCQLYITYSFSYLLSFRLLFIRCRFESSQGRTEKYLLFTSCSCPLTYVTARFIPL